MKRIIKYMFLIMAAVAMNACALDEPFYSTEEGQTSFAEVEFVARPTNFSNLNVSTKATSSEIDAIENTIYSAFFLVYNSDGTLIKYENLTGKISSGSVPSQTLTTEKGLENITVCYVANLPESFVKKNMALTDEDRKNGTFSSDLKKFQNTEIEFKATVSNLQAFKIDKPSDAVYVGTPVIDVQDDLTKTPNPHCLPMLGVWNGDLTGVGTNKTVEISVKRLFAKVGFTIKLELKDPTATSQLQLNSMVVNRIPRFVNLFPQTGESSYATSMRDRDFLDYDLDYTTVPFEGVTIQDNKEATFYFYVPEFIVFPNSETIKAYKDKGDYKEIYKPEFIGKKRATNVLFKASINNQGQELDVDYTVYLGENELDDFSLKRNNLYNNQIKIVGFSNAVFETDHRVTVSYDGIGVAFKRSTLLDSHFEVRPIRVKLSDELKSDTQGGTITVEVLDVDSDLVEDAPGWLRLERPRIDPDNPDPTYCLTTGDKGYSYTKRKYFTTDLLKDERLSASISYDPFESSYGDLDGTVPIWLYIDEYTAAGTDKFNAEEVRSARVRVKYTPKDKEAVPITQDFKVQQRAIYPIQSTLSGSANKVYGIEFFEEYQHDYDVLKPDVDWDDEGGVYHSDFNGMQWGLNNITLSRNNKALYVTKAEPTFGDGTDPKAKDGFEQVEGILSVFLDEIMSTQVETLPAFYDFYAAADDNTGIISNIDTREYEGYEMNVEIIHHLLEIYQSDENVLLNGFTLDKSNPLSAIAYCYNKNKRDADGNVVTLTGEHNEIVNIQNLHWYVPCIEEIEDIITSAYDLEEEFSVFTEKFYWSCQPAHHINQVNISYNAHAVWEDRVVNLGGWPPYKVEANRDVYFNMQGLGPYYQDDKYRARATSFNLDENNPISSSVDGNYARLATTGTNDFGTIGSVTAALFYGQLATKMSRNKPTWNPANPEPEQTGETLTYDEGNDLRNETNRIRCIYNPSPPKTATRAAGENGSFTYTYSYE